MDKEPDNLRRNIRFLMQQNGYGENATRLAEAIGMNQPTLHRIMKSESSDPKISNLRKIASYFGVTVGDLLDSDMQAIVDNGPSYAKRPTLVDMAKRTLRLRDALQMATYSLQVIDGANVKQEEVARVAAAIFEIANQADTDVSALPQEAITSAVLSALSG